MARSFLDAQEKSLGRGLSGPHRELAELRAHGEVGLAASRLQKKAQCLTQAGLPLERGSRCRLGISFSNKFCLVLMTRKPETWRGRPCWVSQASD